MLLEERKELQFKTNIFLVLTLLFFVILYGFWSFPLGIIIEIQIKNLKFEKKKTMLQNLLQARRLHSHPCLSAATISRQQQEYYDQEEEGGRNEEEEGTHNNNEENESSITNYDLISTEMPFSQQAPPLEIFNEEAHKVILKVFTYEESYFGIERVPRQHIILIGQLRLFDMFIGKANLFVFLRNPNIFDIEEYLIAVKQLFGHESAKFTVCNEAFFNRWSKWSGKKECKGTTRSELAYAKFRETRRIIFTELENIFWRPSSVVTCSALEHVNLLLVEDPRRAVCPLMISNFAANRQHIFGICGHNIVTTTIVDGAPKMSVVKIKTFRETTSGLDHNPFTHFIKFNFDSMIRIIYDLNKLKRYVL